MTVRELNKKQLNELKEAYVTQLADCGEDEDVIGISYAELADAAEIPDEIIFNHYNGIIFTNDDFFCSCESGE